MVQSTPSDDATRKRIDAKMQNLLAAVPIDDAGKSERVKQIVGDWLVVMWDWHRAHDEQLGKLWSQWGEARSVVPKDEFPGEVIAHQIDAEYASLVPAYRAFIEKLAAELTPEQVDAFKERWSRSPGMTRTYNAYMEIVPDLTEQQQQVILDRMKLAREAAMLTDSDREIVNIYKRHKIKVEQYVGSLEWARLHRAYAQKGKPPATTPATQPGGVTVYRLRRCVR